MQLMECKVRKFYNFPALKRRLVRTDSYTGPVRRLDGVWIGVASLDQPHQPAAHVGGLSVIQWACLAVLAYYAPHVPRLVLGVSRG